jgi:hypothetical protein
MSISLKQRRQRKCFAGCAQAWNNLPDECPAAPDCGGTATKKSVYDHHQDLGIQSSYYDFFMRCCLQLCDANGVLTGDVNSCWPCDPTEDPVAPDPANPEVVQFNDLVTFGVIHGVGPYLWEWASEPCGTMSDTEGEQIDVQMPASGCCWGRMFVTDACGDMAHIGFRIDDGSWVLLDEKVCYINGPQTDVDIIISAEYKIWEVLGHENCGSSTDRCCEGCEAVFSYYSDPCCAAFNCQGDNYPGCDHEVGCDVLYACITENRRQGNCYYTTSHCYPVEDYCCQPPDTCCKGGLFKVKFCLKRRDVFLWTCN